MTVVGVILVDNMTEVGEITIGEDEAAEIGEFADHLTGADASTGGQMGTGHRYTGGGRSSGRRGGRYASRGRPAFRHPSDKAPRHKGRATFAHHDEKQSDANDKFEKTAREGTGAVKYTGADGPPEGAPGAGVSDKATDKDVPTRTATDKSPKMGGHLSGQRERFADELKAKPHLRERFQRMIQQEDPADVGAQMEEHMNRASSRKTSLEEAISNRDRYFGDKGGGSNPTAETRRRYEEELPAVLAGSNRIKYGTGNASLDVGVGRQTYRSASGERYGVETPDAAWAAEMERQGASGAGGKFSVVARHAMPGGFGPGSGATADMLPTSKLPEREAASVSRVSAVGGNDPAAFIMHHTSGGGNVEGVRETLRQRGLGVQYVMDREGNIYHTGGSGASHMMTGWGKGAGLSNRNTVGMEVIAKGDWDVNRKQVESAARFMQQHYPTTPVYGHGEVNPGHKEADEGMTIVNRIREQRQKQQPAAQRAGKQSAIQTPMRVAAVSGRALPTAGQDDEGMYKRKYQLEERERNRNAVPPGDGSHQPISPNERRPWNWDPDDVG